MIANLRSKEAILSFGIGSMICFCRLLASTKVRYAFVVIRKPDGTGKEARVIRLRFAPLPPTLAKIASGESKEIRS